MKKFRVVVLASGSGSLLQALIDRQNIHGGELVGLITDIPCRAQARARNANIPVTTIEVGLDRSNWNKKLLSALNNLNPDLIVSAGFMRIIGTEVLEEFEGKIINIHPALLPNFPGSNAVRDTLIAGAKITGTTVHFVDSGIDTGEIISQKEVEILPNDTEASLHNRIKLIEQELIVNVVADFASGKLNAWSKS